MSNTPANPALYSRVKSAAKRKFKIFPSAYASAWIVKEYKKEEEPTKAGNLVRLA